MVQRISATGIEKIVSEATRRWLPSVSDLFAILSSVCVSEHGLQIMDTAPGSPGHSSARCSDLAMHLLPVQAIQYPDIGD